MKHIETTNAPDTLDIFHHIGVINTDLNILSEHYEKLGFLLTPVSTPRIIIKPGGQPEELGLGNRHAIFEENYIELLGIVDPQKWENISKDKLGPYNIDIPLKRYQGLHVMHFGTSHIELVKKRFREQEIPCSEIKHFQRNVQTDKGEQTMRARTLFFPPENNPEGLVQVAQHDTPELVFQPKHMGHLNGATGLSELVLCGEDPKGYVSKYEKLTAHKGSQIEDKHYRIDLGDSQITVIAPEHLAQILPDFTPPVIPFMAAFIIDVSDLQLTRNVLKKNVVPFTEKKGRIAVSPEYGGGCAVIFKRGNHIN
jgi:hypothetical protein